MTSFRTRIIAITGAAAVAGISAAVLISSPSFTQAQATTTAPQSKPVAPGGPGNQLTGARGQMNHDPAQMEQRRKDFLAHLAARLNTTPENLQNAFKQAHKDNVADLLKQGKITQEQADRINARIDQGAAGAHGHAQNGQQGPGGQRGAGGPQFRALEGIMPGALGMTPQDFRAAIQSGKTPMQIATGKGMSRDAFKAAISAQLEQRLTQAKQQGTLTDQQISDIRSRAAQMIDRMIDNAGRRFGPGGQRQPKPAGQ